MKLVILSLVTALGMYAAVPSVSNVSATFVSHGTALINFTVANASPDPGNILFNFARICWSATAGACAGNTGAQVYMPTSYPSNGSSGGTRNQPAWSIILTGLPPSTIIQACPELSMDHNTWSADVCTTFTTLGQPSVHPVLAERPRVSGVPQPPSDYTGFHAGASSPGGGVVVGAPPFPVTSCANLQSDIQAALASQDQYGTVISLAPGQASKCVGRYYPQGNPPGVREFNDGNVNASTSTITIFGHGLTEGHGVQFARNYTDLPGEYTPENDCTGIKPAQVYYAHFPSGPDPDKFQLTCDYPYPQGRLMRFANPGGGPHMYMAAYPRRKDQGGNLYPIVIRTATPDSQLPPSGTRISPAWASKLAVLEPDCRAPGKTCFYPKTGQTIQNPTLNFGSTDDDGYLFLTANIWGIGLEIQGVDATGDTSGDPFPTWQLVQFKDGSSDNGLERCYIHGQYPYPSRIAHGISFEGHNNAVLDSYFDRIVYPRANNSDSAWLSEGSQFFETSRGPGPLFFVNNFFQSTGNGMHFNGAGDRDWNTKLIKDVYLVRNTYTQNPPDNHQQYCIGNPGSDGFEYRNRQPLEFKGGYRILVDGNIFEYDCHFLASSMIAITSVTAGIDDITLSNNTIRHASSGTMMGSCTQGGPPVCQSPTNRYNFFNNLFWDLDGVKYTDHFSTNWPQGWRGWVVQTVQDGEDMIYDHNTGVSASGFLPAQFYLASGGAEGLQVTNSILIANQDGQNSLGRGARLDGGQMDDEANSCGVGLIAEALLKCGWRYPFATVNANLLVSDGLDSTTILAAWPTQKTTATPSNLNLVGWEQPSYSALAPSFRLNSTSTYNSGGGSPAGDGLQQGADIDKLEKAQGKVYLAGAVPGSTTASVNFVAPDAQACPVDVSSTDGTLLNSFTRFGDTGGSAGPRTVGITGLNSRTDYFFRVDCAVEQPTGTFHTN